MSAQDSPVCGRSAGRFSTLTAKAGRPGTFPFAGGSPVSGHTGGGADGEEEGEVTPSLPLARGPTPALPPRNTMAPATPPATMRVATTEATTPRRVNAMRGNSLREGR